MPQAPSKETSGRLCPTNLILLQRQINNITRDNSEFRNTRSGAKIITKEMADFPAIKNSLKLTTFPILHSPQNLKTP
jgi:hypothetical protein